ncbi:YhcN/YlaJ family sporulation lipoprotein [Bacillus sp. EB01]|uniref:YhcN/YlaJ family sporulation lipoprotein n=1 Tax=Bacillus sp. EB01 TaxID=1347086 RepID=UPI0005C4894D|nr:YhcN/YlaJ family sporulation lipoprotein [Bacillus sp. EB01]
MKKQLYALSLCGLLLAGCGGENAGADRYGNNTHMYTNNRRAEVLDQGEEKKADKSQRFGFVRHYKSPIMGDRSAKNDHEAPLDRQELAGHISRISTDLPNVNEVVTLVTDEEVLIAYETDTNNRELTADQVKRTAMSFVPRFFHVYVSDNKMLMNDIETLSSLNTSSKNSDAAIAAVIKEMKKSPQGKRMNESENENGETPDDKEELRRMGQ